MRRDSSVLPVSSNAEANNFTIAPEKIECLPKLFSFIMVNLPSTFQFCFHTVPIVSILILIVLTMLLLNETIPGSDSLDGSVLDHALSEGSPGLTAVIILSVVLTTLGVIIVLNIGLEILYEANTHFSYKYERFLIACMALFTVVLPIVSVSSDATSLPIIYALVYFVHLIGHAYVFLIVLIRVFPGPNAYILNSFFLVLVCLGALSNMAGLGLPATSALNIIPFLVGVIVAPIFLYLSYKVFLKSGFFKWEQSYLVQEVYLNIYISAAAIKLIIIFISDVLIPVFEEYNSEWAAVFLFANVVFTWLTCVLPNYISHFRYSIEVSVCQELQQQERTAAAQALIHQKEETIRYISHEMRTPIMISSTAIKHAIDDLSTLQISPSVLDILSDGERACHAALVILNDMLTYETLNAGKYILHREYICIFPFLEYVVRQNKILCDEKNVSLQLSTELDHPAYAYVDASKLEQVFRNLISNSVKFSNHGTTIFVRLMNDSSQIGSSSPIEEHERFRADGVLSISITDEGVGITPENIQTVFGQFNQFDPHILQGGGGTGLGLFISQKIVQGHEGVINVFSEGIGRGTTFNIRIKGFKENQDAFNIGDKVFEKNALSRDSRGDAYLCYVSYVFHIWIIY